MNIRPIGDRVLIAPDSGERNVGGIIVPESDDFKRQGTVTACSDTILGNPADLRPGNRVFFNPYAAIETPHGLIVEIKDVLAVIS